MSRYVYVRNSRSSKNEFLINIDRSNLDGERAGREAELWRFSSLHVKRRSENLHDVFCNRPQSMIFSFQNIEIQTRQQQNATREKLKFINIQLASHVAGSWAADRFE